MSRKVVQYAPDVFRKLRGVICVYKPKDLTDKGLRHDIINSLKRDLEGLPNYKYERKALKKTLAELPSGDSKQSDSGGQAVVQYTGVVSPGSSGLAYYANLPVPDGMPLSQHRLGNIRIYSAIG
ncbi:hypothetical protein FSP39_019801 [Pinctada imbricata]|uniref:Uncharacterized protein n=1 Tax=Pinctada imbricata TaxID=66713 RepID=A0AA88XTM1_PINIB|nr:hypothetical protein FSP39_019801 [Pinctada imbricata]